MGKKIKNYFSLQIIKICTLIDSVRRAELKYIIFNLIWTVFLPEKIQKTIVEKSNSVFEIKNKSNGGLNKILYSLLC